jgi:hypothetical protein
MPTVAQQLVAPAPDTDEPRALLARAPAALRTFFGIAEAWGLRPAEQQAVLGSPVPSTFYRWRDGSSTGGVTVDTMERLSHVFGIYAALHRIFLEPARADQWLSHPNDAPIFGGGAPRARLVRGRVADLVQVRRFVEQVAEAGL